MARQLFMVLSEAVEGREDDYNDWYENTHLDEVIATSAVVSAQRFKLADRRGVEAPNRYLAIYEVEVDDPGEVFPSVDAGGDKRNNTDALDRSSLGAWVWTPIGVKHGG
ncbi:MAG: hypothetical protein V3S87_14220 [Alphaproteobacteria bacterium]